MDFGVELSRFGFIVALFAQDLVLHLVLHYDNTPIQYIVIFHSFKNVYFQIKKCDIFLIFAQNIDCGYTLVRRF